MLPLVIGVNTDEDFEPSRELKNPDFPFAEIQRAPKRTLEPSS